jgi:hypothetical protein
MSTTETSAPRYGRRIAWLGVAVVIALILYTVGWFYLADRLEKSARSAIADMNRDGASATCDNPTARGYPFRLGLFCDRIAFARPQDGISLTAGAFRSAGQIYDPSRFVAELDGPAVIGIPIVGDISVDWSVLRASVRVARPLPERLSIEGQAIEVATPDGRKLGTARAVEAHARPAEADLELAARFMELAVDAALASDRVIPTVSGEADIVVADGVALLQQDPPSLRGRSGTVRTLNLTLGGGALTLSGPYAIDAEGLMDAQLTVGITNPQSISTQLSAAFPEQERQIQQVFAGLALLGNAPQLPLNVTKGAARLAFVPLGTIPPVD